MKKFNLLFLTMVLIISIFNISFATEAEDDSMYLYTNESGELVQSDEFEYGDAELITDSSEYEDIYNNSSHQEEMKEAFEAQKAEFLVKNEEDSSDTTKIVITEILSDLRTEYTTDYYYYYIVKYQNVKFKTEDGIETTGVIILSYDVADNKSIKPVKAGDTIYAYVENVSSNSEEYNMIQHGLTDERIALISIIEQDRSLGVILLTVLTLLLLVLYAGKNGTKLLIPIFVAIDLLFIVLVPEIQIGKSVLILSILIALELIILITVLKNGLSRKTAVAILSSITVVVIVSVLGIFFASTNNITGRGIISEENYDLQTNVYYIDQIIKTKIDTQMLYISMIIIITATISATIASKLTELSEKYAGSNNMVDNIIEEAKQTISEYPMIIAIIFLVMALPKYMAILYNGTLFNELINSEILITDLSMLLITLISAVIISPIHAIVSNLLMGDVEIKQIENK